MPTEIVKADITEQEPEALVAHTDGLTPTEFAQALADAQKKAQMLRKIIGENHWAKQIGNGEHILIEAWLTMARAYGMTARAVGEPKKLQGYPHAYQATSEVVQITPVGPVVVGRATALCGTTNDRHWNDEKTPEHHVISMAQTRANSKVIASVLRWVAVLAGYSGTPYEEMDGVKPAKATDAEASDTLISEPVPEGDMWCSEHNLEFFKRGAMRNYAHPVVNEDNVTIRWCNRPKEEPVQGSLEG